MNVDHLVLLVLDALGSATVARIHKLVFLVVAEGGVETNASFKPHYFGPWSPEVRRALDELVTKGFATLETSSQTEDRYALKVYRITENGRKEARRVIAEADEEELRRLKRVISRFGHTPLSLIVAYIYHKYPEYTELSKIREKVERIRSLSVH